MNARLTVLATIVVVLLSVLSSSAVLSLIPLPIAHADTNLLSDQFTRDTSLNTNTWQVNGPVGRNVGLSFTPQPFTIITPSLSFSSLYGLGVSGVGSSQHQFSSIESVTGFSAPFTVQANVEASLSHSKPFGLIVSWNGGQKSVGIFGDLNNTDSSYPYGIQTWTGDDSFSSFLSTPDLPSPAVNIPFNLTISMATSGPISLSVVTGAKQGSTSINICPCTGPFNVVLGQYIGGADPGPNQAYWQAVSVSPGRSPSLIGPVINQGCTSSAVPCQVNLASGPNPDFTTTYNMPLQTTYLYAATDEGANDAAWLPCCQTGFDYIGLDLSVSNQNGLSSVVIGHSFGNDAWASYSSNGPLTPIAGGVGVVGAYSEAFSFNSQGQTTLSGSFSLPMSAYVVLVSAGSNLAGFNSATGPFGVDGKSANGGSILFAHASLSSGQYSFSLNFQQGNDARAAAIGVMLYVFASQSLAVPFSLSMQGTSNPSGSVQLTSGSVTLGSMVLPLSGSSTGGQCENGSSSDVDTLCNTSGSYFYHLAGTNVQVGNYFMSVGACYIGANSNSLSLTFVPGWPPYCAGPTQITLGLGPCAAGHIDLPGPCAITGQIIAIVSATGTYTDSNGQVTISAQGSAVETNPSASGTNSGGPTIPWFLFGIVAAIAAGVVVAIVALRRRGTRATLEPTVTTPQAATTVTPIQPSPSLPFCGKCGAKNSPESAFCSKCGAPMR